MFSLFSTITKMLSLLFKISKPHLEKVFIFSVAFENARINGIGLWFSLCLLKPLHVPLFIGSKQPSAWVIQVGKKASEFSFREKKRMLSNQKLVLTTKNKIFLFGRIQFSFQKSHCSASIIVFGFKRGFQNSTWHGPGYFVYAVGNLSSFS